MQMKSYVKCAVALVLYLAFLYWVGSWWGLLVVPFIVDYFVTKKINWYWWKRPETSPGVRSVMAWVDAIVFALVAVYFFNQFFFQNYVIPSSSLEKTLLTGDYLLVSKLSYGPRIPQTPLTMPLTQHTLPVLGTKSYLEWPHWEYRRVKGLGKPQLNDIVVFNYSAGDTVALKVQDQDYYRLAYEIGEQLLTQQGIATTVSDSMDFEQQQAVYAQMYNTGKMYIAQNPEMFGEVVARPADRCENYVKRCVGLPGQTLQIKNNIIYLDGKPNREPENVQYLYLVKLKSALPDELKRDLGITNEDLSGAAQNDPSTVYMPLTNHVKQVLQSRRDLVERIQPAPPASSWLYPLNMKKNWTTANYGPVWIPKKGAKLRLTLQNLPIYERPIRAYEGNTLAVRNGKIYINGKPTEEYTFKYDYYWMQGDNRDNSADSRFWGFVPETQVVGKPLLVWLSLDPDYGWFDGKIRWSRLFKWVANIR